MISNITSGTDFGGLFRYLTGDVGKNGDRREEIIILGGTIPGEKPSEWSFAMDQITKLRPSVTVPVKHYSLRFAPEDIAGGKVNPEMMSEMAAEYVERMGATAYLAIAHGHQVGVVDHFHIAVNKVRHDGGVVDDSFDYYRSQDICRDFERRYGLRIVRSSNEIDPLEHKKQPSHYELAIGDSNRLRLQAIVDGVMSKPLSATEFADTLSKVGVGVRFNINKTGIYGVSFDYQGMSFKGQALGKSFTAGNLKKRGLSYVESRELAELDARGCIAKPTGNQPGLGADASGASADRGGSEEVRREDAGIDRAASGMSGTVGSGHVHFSPPAPSSEQGYHKFNEGQPRGNEDQSRGNGEPSLGNHQTSESNREGVDAGGVGAGGGEGSFKGDKKRRVREDVKALADLLGRDSAFNRVVSLAVADHIEQVERVERNGGGEEDRQRVSGGRLRGLFDLASAIVPRNTIEAIRRHISSIGTDRVEVAVLPPKDRKDMVPMPRKFWSAEQATDPKNIRWLQAKNAQGYDIYVAPGNASNEGVVLLDDMTKDDVKRMSNDGFVPVTVIETSTDNFQCWVRVSSDSLTEEEGTAAAEVLARTYGADPNSADWRHLGRLAGFTNRKAKHVREDGKSPFVALRYSKPGLAARGPELMAAVRNMIAERHVAPEPEVMVVNVEERVSAIRRSHNGYGDNPTSFFLHHAALLETRCLNRDGKTNWSEVDYGAAAEMLKAGYSEREIIDAIIDCSPGLDSRKSNAQNYAQRTFDKAAQDPRLSYK